MITLLQSPTPFSSAHSRLDYVVSSDKTAEPNFKYIFEVYIANQKIGTFKQYPEPGTGLAVFNAARVVRAYLNPYYFDGAAMALSSVPNEGTHQITYQIKYGEEYGTPPTAYLNVLTGETQASYNYYPDLLHVADNAQLSAYAGGAMTNRPSRMSVLRNEVGYFPVFNPTGTSLGYTIKTFSTAGTQLATHSYTIPYRFAQMGYTPRCLNAAFGNQFIGESVAHYTIQIGAKTFRFDVEPLYKYNPNTLVFLNRLGGYETVHLRTKSTRSLNIERKHYGSSTRHTWRNGSTGGSSVFQPGSAVVYLPNQRTHYIRQKERLHLTSDFLSDHEFKWLRELACSPVVYLHIDNGNTAYYIPLAIEATSFEFKTLAVHGVNHLDIQAEVLLDFNSQLS
ncbi:MAG: hypothetical protein EOP49_20000 [Sphingobacteriales bacterium]|nr:MAG: hypothetical protein EOP49_20000 [Sphingobacteriales bacterium]